MKIRGRVLSLVAVLLFATGVPGSASAADWDVAQLMQSLAQQRGGRVLFTEKKHIAMLDRPVESSGELVYQPPARLEKRTLKPQVESLVLDGDMLVVERGKQKRTLQLAQYPEVAAVVDSLRDTLAGNLKALERQYRVDLQGAQDRWTLTLLPSDTRIAATHRRLAPCERPTRSGGRS